MLVDTDRGAGSLAEQTIQFREDLPSIEAAERNEREQAHLARIDKMADEIYAEVLPRIEDAFKLAIRDEREDAIILGFGTEISLHADFYRRSGKCQLEWNEIPGSSTSGPPTSHNTADKAAAFAIARDRLIEYFKSDKIETRVETLNHVEYKGLSVDVNGWRLRAVPPRE